MLVIIFSWLVLGYAIYLIGRLVLGGRIRKFLHVTETVRWYEYFWLGLVTVFGVLQVWSLFLPINTVALIFVFALAGVSFFVSYRSGFRFPKVNVRFVTVAAILLFGISYFASLSVGWPDTYGYHLIAVKWANLYKVVPGLANLYTRLGFNSSFFLFAAMVDNLILKDRSSHVALSLLTSVLALEFLWIFVKSKNKYLKWFILLALPIFVEGIVHDVQVSSLSYDFAVLIIILAVCVELIENTKPSIIIASALSFMLVTVKLSGAFFAAGVVAFGLYKSIFLGKRSFLILISTGTILLVPYLIRNIILSGWPLYPLPLFRFNVSWAMPYERVAELFTVIKGWAIFGLGWHAIIGKSFIEWFPLWFSQHMGSVDVRILFLAALLILASIPLKFLNRKTLGKNTGLAICALASFASIFYLLYSAPDLRFGGIFFWVFFASVGSFFLVKLTGKIPILGKILTIFLVFLIPYGSWPPRMDSYIMLRSIRWDQPGSRDIVRVSPKDGSPSFDVYVARSDSSCGNSELPCTSEVSNDFKEIVPGDISKGFAPVR